MNDYEKMLSGKIYNPGEPTLNKLAHDQHNLGNERES